MGSRFQVKKTKSGKGKVEISEKRLKMYKFRHPQKGEKVDAVRLRRYMLYIPPDFDHVCRCWKVKSLYFVL